MKSKYVVAVVATLGLSDRSARAQTPSEPPPSAPPEPETTNTAAPPTPVEAAKPAPAPYSLPWQLRPLPAVTVLRLDSTIAPYENAAAASGLTFASLLTFAYKIPGTGKPGEGLAAMARATIVTDAPPGNAQGGTSIVNPLLGVTYGMKFESGLRLNAFFAVTVPIGGGGGNSPDPGALDARLKGPNARAQMDNALFAVNDLTVIPGIGIGYVKHGFTIQGELTLLELIRVRGDARQREATKTNFTAGLHVGYFVIPSLSLGAELRHQRWLNAPFTVDADTTGTLKDTTTVALGVRAHLALPKGMWMRPGISYARAIDKPLAGALNYHFVQLDLPLFF